MGTHHVSFPEGLGGLFGQNKALAGSVERSFAELDPWLNFSGMPFFPAFTDHGPDHHSRLLATADGISGMRAGSL